MGDPQSTVTPDLRPAGEFDFVLGATVGDEQYNERPEWRTEIADLLED